MPQFSSAMNSVKKLVDSEFARLRSKGMAVEYATSAANTIAAFKSLENYVVKLDIIADQDSYDYSDIDDRIREAAIAEKNELILEKKELQSRIANDGVWGVISEWRPTEEDDWEKADSTWGFVGDDWKDSGYDIDLMRSALKAFVDDADKKIRDGIFEGWASLEVARFGLTGSALPPEQSSPTPAPTLSRISGLSKTTFRIRQTMYGFIEDNGTMRPGWDIVRKSDLEQNSETMTTAIEPRSEAVNVAKSYADDLALRHANRTPLNTNVIRVLDEWGQCIYAVRALNGGTFTKVPCPESIIIETAPKTKNMPLSNPLSSSAKTAIGIASGLAILGGIGYILWHFFGVRAHGAPASNDKPTHTIQLVPNGHLHISGYNPGDCITLTLPPGARWGGITDTASDNPVPPGAQPYAFCDPLTVTAGSIGATWWDAQNNATATTVTYG